VGGSFSKDWSLSISQTKHPELDALHAYLSAAFSIQFIFEGIKAHEHALQFLKIMLFHFSGSFSANGRTYWYFYHAFSS